MAENCTKCAFYSGSPYLRCAVNPEFNPFQPESKCHHKGVYNGREIVSPEDANATTA
jgi:hypothetical protein